MKKILILLLLAAGMMLAVEVQPWIENRYLFLDSNGNPNDTFVAPTDSIYTVFMDKLGHLSTETFWWDTHGSDSFSFYIQPEFATYPYGIPSKPDTSRLGLWIFFYKVVAANADTIGFWPFAELTYLGTNIGWFPHRWSRVKIINLDADTLFLDKAAFYGAGSP